MESGSDPSTVSSRSYDGTRRQAEARARRLRIVEAARDLFLRDGFGATSIERIATAAEVSVQTIYAAFKGKAGLLAAAIDLAVAGDDSSAPMQERPDMSWVGEERDPVEWLRLAANHMRLVNQRVAELLHLLDSVAGSDPALAELSGDLLERRRIDGVFAIQASPIDPGSVGMTVEEAGDVLALFGGPLVWMELVVHRGWNPERFEAWVFQLLTDQFVPDSPRPAAR